MNGNGSELAIVFRPEVTREQFSVAAKQLKFVFVESYPPDGKQAGYEEVWAFPRADYALTAINYTESPLIRSASCTVRGNQVAGFADQLVRLLPAYSADELITAAMEATEHNQQVLSLHQLAIGFITWDPRVFTVIGTFATQSQNAVIREVAVHAMGYRAWSQFRQMLEKIAVMDPSEQVRQQAVAILPFIPTEAV